MTRCINEGNELLVVTRRDRHAERAGRLGDPARFAISDIGIADPVKQRSLAVVHMAKDRDDRATGTLVLALAFGELLGDLLLSILGLGDLKLDVPVDHDLLGLLRIDRRVDRRHDALHEELLDDVRTLDTRRRRQVLDRERGRDGDLATDLGRGLARVGARTHLVLTLLQVATAALQACLTLGQVGRRPAATGAEIRPITAISATTTRIARTTRGASLHGHAGTAAAKVAAAGPTRGATPWSFYLLGRFDAYDLGTRQLDLFLLLKLRTCGRDRLGTGRDIHLRGL